MMNGVGTINNCNSLQLFYSDTNDMTTKDEHKWAKYNS